MDKENYVRLKKECIEAAKQKKKAFIVDKLKDNSSKSLYATVNRLTDNTKENTLPSAESETKLAQTFANFFKEKIEKNQNQT